MSWKSRRPKSARICEICVSQYWPGMFSRRPTGRQTVPYINKAPVRPVPHGQSFDTNTSIQLSKIRRGYFMTVPRTFAKDLSFASSKSMSTSFPIARYAIFKTCHLSFGKLSASCFIVCSTCLTSRLFEKDFPRTLLICPICPIASPVGTSQTCRGCRENFSLPGRGAAPHTLPISQSSNPLCVLCDFQSILAVLPAVAGP